jgi:hypothetical protein
MLCHGILIGWILPLCLATGLTWCSHARASSRVLQQKPDKAAVVINLRTNNVLAVHGQLLVTASDVQATGGAKASMVAATLLDIANYTAFQTNSATTCYGQDTVDRLLGNKSRTGSCHEQWYTFALSLQQGNNSSAEQHMWTVSDARTCADTQATWLSCCVLAEAQASVLAPQSINLSMIAVEAQVTAGPQAQPADNLTGQILATDLRGVHFPVLSTGIRLCC